MDKAWNNQFAPKLWVFWHDLTANKTIKMDGTTEITHEYVE